MTRDELVEALTKATSLVLSAGKSEISFDRFLDAYDNFYYRYALDGHEAEPELRLLSEFQWAIAFHRQVQEDVLGHVYLHDDPHREHLKRIGRIDPEEARARLTELCEEQGAEEILRKLAE
jgi:hypothetical protein